MSVFSVEIPQVATAAVANAFTTLVGLKFANTAGHRARLRRLVISGGGGAPQDEQVAIRLTRADNTGAGTATPVDLDTIQKNDPDSVASNVAAIGKTYTAEPTTKGTDLGGVGGLNARGILIRDWSNDPGNAPKWIKNTTLCIDGAPGQAVAVNLTIAVEWEEY